MRHRVLRASVTLGAAVATAVAAVLLGAPTALAANLLTNPGFEAGMTGWSCTGGLGSSVTSPVRTGSRALAGAASAADNARCTQTLTVRPSTTYAVSGWVRGNYVYLGVTNGPSTWTPSATVWTQLSISFTTGANQTSAQLFLHGWYGQGTYYADDVVFDGPGTGPSPSPSSSVITDPPPPGKPGNPSVTSVTNTSIGLTWGASSGTVTGYRVYQASTVRATTTGTSATLTGLTPCTSYTYTIRAYGFGESPPSNPITVTTTGCPSGGKKSWPYLDITSPTPSLVQVANATGHKHFTLAFVIGSHEGCVPKWGGTIPLNEPRIVNDINALKAMGGDVTIAFGGAVGPYLEHLCGTQAQLAGAYKQVIDVLGIKHLDIDVEASVNVDLMNKALRQVQQERPGTIVSYTLMVQGDDYGLTPQLGYDVLVNAKANGVIVGLVNPMTMEFGTSRPNWGDAVIAAAQATLGQMAQIWPEKSDAQRKAMLGVTPMIGRNFNGKIFTQAHANQLVSWANTNKIGALAFWSVGRDNGSCPGGGVSPSCSSISQSTYEFTNIFKGFTG